MSLAHRSKLEQLGLSPAEAHVYLAVLVHGPLAAPAIASQTGVARTSVYPTLCSLAEKGLIEGGLGHGSKFTAVAPEDALHALVAREEQTLAERQQIARELAETLAPLAADADSALDDSVQVIRTPHLIVERYQRLQLEATRLVEVIIKAPIFLPSSSNPTQRKVMRRGVRYKSLYERAVMDDPKVERFLPLWIAEGEEARAYDGELPYKLAVFDQEIVLVALARGGGPPAAMLVRNAPFARSMSILFEFFWNQSVPLSAAAPAETAGSPRKRKSNPRQAAAGIPNAQSRTTRGNTHLNHRSSTK
jgi:HTH-type transcriptional regulator, sugar sensing transcriptional regulator